MKKSLVVLIIVLFMSGCSNSPEVEMIQNGQLSACKNATVKQMVDSFMGSPKWSSGVSESGMSFVNIEGDITFQEKPIKAAIQFEINKESGSFGLNAVEFNGIPQNKLMGLGLLNKMCEST